MCCFVYSSFIQGLFKFYSSSTHFDSCCVCDEPCCNTSFYAPVCVPSQALPTTCFCRLHTLFNCMCMCVCVCVCVCMCMCVRVRVRVCVCCGGGVLACCVIIILTIKEYSQGGLNMHCGSLALTMCLQIQFKDASCTQEGECLFVYVLAGVCEYV